MDSGGIRGRNYIKGQYQVALGIQRSQWSPQAVPLPSVTPSNSDVSRMLWNRVSLLAAGKGGNGRVSLKAFYRR